MSNQTYELARSIGDDLKKKFFPFPVIYGPERTARATADNVIVFERDRETSEKMESAKGTQANGRKHATRRVPVKITMFVRSSLAGAREIDHEELADYLVDAVVVSLDEWSTAQKGGGIEFGEMAFLTPEELTTYLPQNPADPLSASQRIVLPEGWAGLVYVMRITIGRGVVKRNYLKAVRPTGVLTGVGNSAEVRLNDDDAPEVEPPDT